MDKRFLDLYNQELKFIRESGAEFAKEYPKIAGRLGLEGFDCSDPYVERLLEGFAFLSARIHRKLDASYPEFTQHLLELLFPTFLQPVPSMLIAQFQPDLDEGSLSKGFTVEKNTSLFSQLGKDEQTACEYKTVQDTQLWPLSITQAAYINNQDLTAYIEQSDAIPSWQLNAKSKPKSAIKISFSIPSHLKVSDLSLDTLSLHFRGSESFPFYLYEALSKGFVGTMIKSADSLWRHESATTQLINRGFDSEQALLPSDQRQFDGFRLLREYFSFPQRFLFLDLTNLSASLARCNQHTFSILLLLAHQDQRLENKVSANNIALHCTPAINLFPKRAERINLSTRSHEYHVIADRLRPLDFEVCSISQVTGFGSAVDQHSPVYPLYSNSTTRKKAGAGYYTQHRSQRLLSVKERKFGHRSSYIGSEVYLSVVDPKNPPFADELRQLSIDVMCCNRDLPIMMPLGKGLTDFSIETGAPCAAIRCVGEPSHPKPPLNQDDTAWDLINLLAINFLGFHDQQEQALDSLTSLLTLMSDKHNRAQNKQLDGLIGFSVRTITSRLPFDGPICFGRGVEIQLTVDESAYEGGSVFLLGMVLDRFFAQYVSTNSFSKFVLNSSERGEIHRWPIRTGSQHTI